MRWRSVTHTHIFSHKHTRKVNNMTTCQPFALSSNGCQETHLSWNVVPRGTLCVYIYVYVYVRCFGSFGGALKRTVQVYDKTPRVEMKMCVFFCGLYVCFCLALAQLGRIFFSPEITHFVGLYNISFISGCGHLCLIKKLGNIYKVRFIVVKRNQSDDVNIKFME